MMCIKKKNKPWVKKEMSNSIDKYGLFNSTHLKDFWFIKSLNERVERHAH